MKFEEEVRPVLLLYGCIYWHCFLGDVRPVTAGHLHVIFAQKKEEGCTAEFAEHISRL